MAFDQRSLDDYVDVAERITEFYDRYPDGRLRPVFVDGQPWRIVQAEGWKRDGEHAMQTFIVYIAAAYRTADDQLPVIGCAWEIFPGRTPYTLGSELMNAETSAWGRALAALGIATKRGIASRQEVQGARERADGLPSNRDGSLSRSQTTDEQKQAAGVMTSAQLAEHSELTKGADRGRVPGTQRLAAVPADDPWYEPPRGPGGEPLPEDTTGSLTPQQRSAIMGGWGDVWKTLKVKPSNQRDWRLAQMGMLLGREIMSTNDLSYRDALLILDAQKAHLAAES